MTTAALMVSEFSELFNIKANLTKPEDGKASRERLMNKEARRQLTNKYLDWLLFFDNVVEETTIKSRMADWEEMILKITPSSEARGAGNASGKELGEPAPKCKMTSFIQRHKALANRFGMKCIDPSSKENNKD